MASDWDKAKKLIDNAASEFKSITTSKIIQEYLTTTVKTRTRLGGGVNETGGSQVKLEIKPTTVKTRRSLKKKGQLSSKTRPAKANLTRTGKMIDSINTSVNSTRDEYTVKVAPSQVFKVKELDKLGYRFMDLTKKEIKGLVELLVERLLKIIK